MMSAQGGSDAQCHRSRVGLTPGQDFTTAALDVVGALVIVMDRDGRVVHLNPEAERVSGRSLEEMRGMPPWDLVLLPDEADAVKRVFESLAAGYFPNEHTNYWVRPDGERRLIHWKNTALAGKDGTVQYVIGTGLDVTERQRAEDEVRGLNAELERRVAERTADLEAAYRELQVSRSIFEELLQAAPDAIVTVDAAGRITLANARAETAFGYARAELLGQPIETLVPERLREAHARHRAGYFAAPRTRPMGVGLELYARRKDGSEFPVEISLSPLKTGEGLLVTAIIRDITQRKNAEEALRKSERKYRTLVENLPQRVFLKDAHSAFISCNTNLARDLGIDPREIAGKTDYDFFPRELADRYRADDRRVLESGATLDLEETYVRQGQTLIVQTTKTPVRDPEGRPVGVLGIFRDITPQKQAEEEIRRLNERLERRAAELEVINRELEAFSYSVSHDLRAPLRSIDGFSQALLEAYSDTLDDTGRDYLQRVRAASQRMAQLIDDMLQLSRITRGEMRRERVDLSALARSVVAELRQSQAERKVEVVIQDGLMAEGDARLLRVVLVNLLGNAWKFTGGQPMAKIEFGVQEQEGRPAYFVRDNGAGFDVAYAGQLFRPFQRLHASNEFPGTGIGLATVQRIIRRHGGRVWAEGEVGKGATFYFAL